jgi:hypothetical protein
VRGRVGARLVGHVVGRNASWLLFHLVSPFNQSVDRLLIIGIRIGMENAVNVIPREGRREIRVTCRKIVFYPAD